LESLSSPIRLSILRSLAYQKLGYSELAKAVGMDKSRDAGKFSYHLKRLLDSGLIEVDRSTGKYALSRRGSLVLKHLEKMEEEMGERTMMIVRRSNQVIEPFDKSKIAEALVREAKISPRLAKEIAGIAERKLLDLKIDYLTAPLIRELVNTILLDMGLEKYRHRLTRVGMPLYDAEILYKKSIEAGDWRIFMEKASGAIEREYMLLSFLPRDVAELHLSGRIDIYPISNWLTGFFSRQFEVGSGDGLEEVANIYNDLLSIKYELKLRGSDEAVTRAVKLLAKSLPRNRVISMNFSSRVLESIGRIEAGRHRIATVINLRGVEVGELARLNRSLTRSAMPHVFSLSDHMGFSGFLLDGSMMEIHSVTTINVLGAALDAGGELEAALRRIMECVEAVIPVMRRGLESVGKVHGEVAGYSIIALSGVFEASRYLARTKTVTIEEAVDIAGRIVSRIAEAVSQHGRGRILLGGRCPYSAAKRFFRIDSYRHGRDKVANLIGKDAQGYSMTPLPRLDEFTSTDEWIEASKGIIESLKAGCYVSLRAERPEKALRSVLSIASGLEKLNENSVIAVRHATPSSP